MSDGVLVAVITIVGTGLAAWIAYLASGTRDLRAQIAVLAGRLDRLEAEKSQALDALSAAASFINRIGLRVQRGSGPWPLPPAQIAQHIDAELWREEREDQT